MVETSDQGNFAMGGWVFKKTPYRKIVVMASDFVAGRHSAEAFIAAFKAAGGEIVKEIYAPLNTPDFAPYMAQVSGLPADAVYAWFGGTDSVRFVKAYREYGLGGKLPLLGYNTLVDDVLLPALGDAALGIISVGHYSATLDTPENRAFVREHEARYNAWPTRYVELGALEEGQARKRGAVDVLWQPRYLFHHFQLSSCEVFGIRSTMALTSRFPWRSTFITYTSVMTCWNRSNRIGPRGGWIVVAAPRIASRNAARSPTSPFSASIAEPTSWPET